MFGYHGKYLHVDLSSGECRTIELREDHLKKFIGGTALAARLIYDKVKPGMDPLSPENPLVFAAGAFQGATIPMASRSAIATVSPLTGYWGEATTGGVFPTRLRATGFDAIYITGKAARPVYLYVKDGKAEMKDASHVWGKDIYETQKILKEELKDPEVSISAIGLAGENMVKCSGVINDRGRAAGRCGVGAVMGSKKLKAVAVSGSAKISVADEQKVAELTRQARETISNNFTSVLYREYGTMLWVDMGMVMGDVPAKYFTRSLFPAQKVTSQAFRQKYVMGNYACYGCPIGCGRLIRNFKGIPEVDGPEYETTIAFGPLCWNFDTDSIVEANHLCNAHGLDTISAGVAIAYAMHLYEKGILTKKKAGMELKWGDGKAVVKLVEMMIKKQGFGELLGQGVRRMAEELGADPEEAAHVKGQEVPMHDARAFFGMAISYATGPRGACHLKGDYYMVDIGSMVMELGILPGDRHQSQGKAEPAAKYQAYRDLFDSMLMCKFAPYTATQLTEMLNAVTGWNCTPADLGTAGERSINIKRAISNKLGLTRKEDKLPRICIQPLNEGSTVGKSPDMDTLLKEYYAFRKWDWETGKPTKEKLVELGLDDVAKDLWG